MKDDITSTINIFELFKETIFIDAGKSWDDSDDFGEWDRGISVTVLY